MLILSEVSAFPHSCLSLANSGCNGSETRRHSRKRGVNGRLGVLFFQSKYHSGTHLLDMNICRNRLRATQQIWSPTSDDEYDMQDTSNFDPIPTATAVACPDMPLDLAHRHESPPVTNSDPTPHFAHQDDTINARQSFHVDLPDIEGDLDPVNFREWKQWSPPRRIAAIRRWVIHAIHRYGPVECWGEDLGWEWNDVRKGDMLAVHYWLDSVKARIKMV